MNRRYRALLRSIAPLLLMGVIFYFSAQTSTGGHPWWDVILRKLGHVTGYALFRSPIDEAAAKAAGAVRAQGGRISVDLSSWSAIRDSGEDAFRVAVRAAAPDVVFANEDEERLLGGPLAGVTWVLKRGAAGIVVDGVAHAAHPAEAVLDTTGAGDALAAGFLVGGPELGLDAAARCVARLGSLP